MHKLSQLSHERTWRQINAYRESVYDHQGCCVYNYLLFLSKLWCIQLGYKRAEKMFQAQIHIYSCTRIRRFGKQDWKYKSTDVLKQEKCLFVNKKGVDSLD